MSDSKPTLRQMLAALSRQIRALEQRNDPQYEETVANLKVRHQALVARLAKIDKENQMNDFSTDELLRQATCAVLFEGKSVGTAWLVSDEGDLLTAGHVLGTDEPADEVEVRFVGDVLRKAQRVEWRYHQKWGLDFAVLKLIRPINRRPLPVSLAREVEGTFRLCGYGTRMKDESQSSSQGEFIGSIHLEHSQSNRLFRLYSPDLGQQGYSGGAVFSNDLQAVVGIQTEAAQTRIGPETNVILAMPLYRVAPLWEPLQKLARESANRLSERSMSTPKAAPKARAVAQDPSTARLSSPNSSRGENSLYIGGHAERSTIVQGNNNVVNSPNAQTGGTRIGRIDATKVTVGAHIEGGTPETGGKVAREILDGKIAIDDVKGEDVVVGLRQMVTVAQPTKEELQQGVATLRTQLEAAIEAGEFADQAAAEDAEGDLTTVQKELAKAKPNPGRIKRKLQSATDILIEASQNAEAAGKTGRYLPNLAPSASALTQLAQNLFGM